MMETTDLTSLPGRAAKSLAYFHQGYSCAQSVFAAFHDCAGMNEAAALKLAAPFGAGIGRMRETCGAFSGVSMLSGVLFGNDSPETEAKEAIYSRVQAMAAQFCEEFGTLRCRDLLHLPEGGTSPARPEDRTPAYYAERPCERCIAFCARMGEELLREHESSGSR